MGGKKSGRNWSYCSIVWLSALLILSTHCQDQLATVRRALQVARGGVAYLQPEDIRFNVALNLPCRIKVNPESTGRLSVGEIHPKVFPCRFPGNFVRYVHNGNPLVRVETIRLTVYHFDPEKSSRTQDLQLTVFINSPDNLIFSDLRPLKPLVVGVGSKFSNVIDPSVVRFRYSFVDEAVCTVTSYAPGYRSKSLLYGALVTADGGTRLSNVTFDCREFLGSGLRYRRDGVSTAARDYIMLRADVDQPPMGGDGSGAWRRMSEALFLPVEVRNGSENTPPRLSGRGRGSVLEVDEFAVLVLSADVVWFVDRETQAKDLVINVTVSEDGCGFVVNVHRPWFPVAAFVQGDLSRRRIGYRAAGAGGSSKRVCELQLSAIDGQFLRSDPVRLRVDIRPAATGVAAAGSPGAVLAVISGRSAALTPRQLRIVDRDDEVELQVVRGGLRHGSLSVFGRAVSTFKISDMEQRGVVYRHNGGDSVEDRIILRITDGKSTVRARVAVSILPNEPTPPRLLTNRSLDVFTDKYILVTPYHLSAEHQHLPDAEIIFNVTALPERGNILKLRHPLSTGRPVSSFSQRDLVNGRVWFRRTAPENFEGADSFRFTLHSADGVFPNPATSEPYSLRVNLKRFVIDRPPRRSAEATMRLKLRESDTARLTRDMLSYADVEKPRDGVFYTVTCSPFFTDSNLTLDAGRLVAVNHDVTKTSIFPSVNSFTQTTIDRGMLTYVPPADDIGAASVNVQFVFSVSDRLGNVLRDERFNITLLPVNDQRPQVWIREAVKIREGGTLVLNSKVIGVSDPDTRPSEVIVTLERLPKSGIVFRDGREMAQNEEFGVEDLTRSALRYVHDGSHTTSDELVFSISDGKHVISKTIPITIVLLSQFLQDQPANSNYFGPVVIEVDEGEEVTVKSSDLRSPLVGSANDRMLTYEVIHPPEHGEIRVRNRPSDRFLGSDLAEGSVSYRHTGGEIGPSQVNDSALVLVGGETDGNYSLVAVEVVVRPVDSAPPRLVLGGPLLVGRGTAVRLTADVISAWDFDSRDGDLTFVVSKSPVWGSLVRSPRSPRAERSNANKHSVAAAFTLSDLKDGAIQYLQLPPEVGRAGLLSDSFLVYVTDGKQNSTVGRVEVAVLNNHTDQQRGPFTFKVDGIVVDEGGQKVFGVQVGPGVVGPRPADPVLSLVETPKHGRVVLVTNAHQNNGVKETVFEDIVVSELLLSGVQLVYQHDGSETVSDQFVLGLSSGPHAARSVVQVRVTPVNDARPEIVRNEVIRVRFGCAEVIGSEFLKAVDADNPDSQVQFIVVSPPRKGTLELDQVTTSSDTATTSSGRKELETGMSFTQRDVNFRLLRYTHTRSLGDLPKDNFIFQLTDSKNFISHETFEIEIVKPESETVVVRNFQMAVVTGASKAITSEHLSTIDSNVNSKNIQFLVTRPPSLGVIEIFKNRTQRRVPVASFNQTDLDRCNVFYSHRYVNSSAVNDSFVFSVRGPRNETISSGVFKIHIVQNHSVPSPILEVNVPLMVVHGSQASITASNLRMSCRNVSAENLVYSVIEPPHYGKILVNDTSVRSFTQRDVDAASVFYRSENTDESMMDYFLFLVFSQSPIGVQAVNEERKPQFFNILIQPISKIAPTVEVVRPLVGLVPLGGDRHGFVLTSSHLLCTHPLFGADDLVYHIRDRSKAGYFENRAAKRPIRRRFTQRDVDDERVAFVLYGGSGGGGSGGQATEETVLLRVTDPNRNSSDSVRLSMHWSLIEWSQSHHIVCEDIRLLPLVVHRRGLTNQSASVHVRTKSVSAREKLDFIARSNATITFAPGVTKINWMVEIINDGIREGQEEKFKVVLRNATGAILGPIDKAIVQLIDYEDGRCTEYIGMISKNRKESHSFENQDIPSQNISKSQPESKSPDLNEEDEYEDYFTRFEDSRHSLLESNLSFYNGGSHETDKEYDYETKDIVGIEPNRKRGSTKDPATTAGIGKYFLSHEPRKITRGVRREKSTSYQKSRNKVMISQPCTQDTKELLYLDLRSSKMFRCSGDHWQPWNWGSGGKSPPPPVMLRDSSAQTSGGEVLNMENFMPSLREDGQKLSCALGWTSYNNSCFMASSARLNWEDAEAACRKDGAHLTHIKSRDHLAWLWSLNDQSQFWIGMHRRDNVLTWQYTDSTTPHFYNWSANHPCGAANKCRHGHCVAVGVRMEFVTRSCDKVKMKYVCVQSPRAKKRSLTRH